MRNEDNEYDVIVIGGGAAGLMAAGQAAVHGAKTLILEKMERPGRKLRITGKGRCNLTNSAPLNDFLLHVHPKSRFLKHALSEFYNDDLITFFNSIGVHVIKERGGRVFPESEHAKDIVEALVTWNRKNNVTIKCHASVRNILHDNTHVTGVEVEQIVSNSDKTIKRYKGRTVVIATGGKSYPATGSTGAGYKLAESCGHKIIPFRPALVPLETKGDVAQKLQGLSLKHVNSTLWINNLKVDEKLGEMLFTHFGLSGPIILTHSRNVVDALREQKTVNIAIDLKPGLTEQQLDKRLLRDFNEFGKRQYKTYLKTLLPQKLISVCIELTAIEADKQCNQISSEERKRLKSWLKGFIFTISGHRPFAEAIITAGGISTKEINSKTMESRLIKGLYLAGEVIDVDADTGGYNLQIAFSTGWVAGNSSAVLI